MGAVTQLVGSKRGVLIDVNQEGSVLNSVKIEPQLSGCPSGHGVHDVFSFSGVNYYLCGQSISCSSSSSNYLTGITLPPQTSGCTHSIFDVFSADAWVVAGPGILFFSCFDMALYYFNRTFGIGSQGRNYGNFVFAGAKIRQAEFGFKNNNNCRSCNAFSKSLAFIL